MLKSVLSKESSEVERILVVDIDGTTFNPERKGLQKYMMYHIGKSVLKEEGKRELVKKYGALKTFGKLCVGLFAFPLAYLADTVMRDYHARALVTELAVKNVDEGDLEKYFVNELNGSKNHSVVNIEKTVDLSDYRHILFLTSEPLKNASIIKKLAGVPNAKIFRAGNMENKETVVKKLSMKYKVDWIDDQIKQPLDTVNCYRSFSAFMGYTTYK
jgi:hypothetical protein